MTQQDCPFGIAECDGYHNEWQDCRLHVYDPDGARMEGDVDEFRSLNEITA